MSRFTCCGIVVLASFSSAPLRAELVDGIAAVVNRQIILISELNSRLGPMAGQLDQIPDRALRQRRLSELQKQALDSMISDKLIEQEALKLKLNVTDRELANAVGQVMKRNQLTEEQLVSALRQEGKSLEDYKRTILRPQLLRLKVLNVQVRSRINIGDEEIKALYQKNLRRLGVDTKIRARHIFIAVPEGGNSSQFRVAQKEAADILARVKSGNDFSELAQKYSHDPLTKGEGGDLGYFSRGTLPAAIEDRVFAMGVGETSGALRSERGFHIVQITERKEADAKPLADVREQLFNQLYATKLEKATQAWLKEVRKRSYIDIKL